MEARARRWGWWVARMGWATIAICGMGSTRGEAPGPAAETRREAKPWSLPGTTPEQTAKLGHLGAATDRAYLSGDLKAAQAAQQAVLEYWRTIVEVDPTPDGSRASAGFRRGAEAWGRYFARACELPPGEFSPLCDAHRRMGESLAKWGRAAPSEIVEGLESVKLEIVSRLGSESPIVGDLETMLADLNFNLGHLEVAEEHAQRAIETYGKLGMDGVRQFGIAALWLGRSQYDQNRRAAAYRNLSRAVATLKNCAPTQDANYLVGRCLLCECKLAIGAKDDAERDLKETLQLHRDMKLDLTGNYAVLAERLGHLLATQQRFREAKPLFEEALVIRELQSAAAPAMLQQTLALYRALPPELQDADIVASATDSLAAAQDPSVRR